MREEGELVWPLLTPVVTPTPPSQYLQLKKKLEDEFPGCLDICGEGTPQATGFFEVMVAGKLVHSKKVMVSVHPSRLVLRLAGCWDLTPSLFFPSPER